MNQQQKNYFIKRVEKIVCEKKALAPKIPDLPVVVRYNGLSGSFAKEMVRAEKVSEKKVYQIVMKAFREGHASVTYKDIFSERAIKAVSAANQELNRRNQAERNSIFEKIDKKAEAIIDEVMFADAEKAIEMLKVFEKGI